MKPKLKKRHIKTLNSSLKRSKYAKQTNKKIIVTNMDLTKKQLHKVNYNQNI